MNSTSKPESVAEPEPESFPEHPAGSYFYPRAIRTALGIQRWSIHSNCWNPRFPFGSKLSGKAPGFTLFELIATLVLLGIIIATVGLFIVTSVKGFVLTRANAELSQKIQNTFNRLTLDFENIYEISKNDATSINYRLRYPQAFNSDQDRYIAYISDPNELKISYSNTAPDNTSGSVLMDNVTAFQLDYQDSNGNPWNSTSPLQELYTITITMTVTHPDPIQALAIPFTVQVCPRRSSRYNGPQNWNH